MEINARSWLLVVTLMMVTMIMTRAVIAQQQTSGFKSMLNKLMHPLGEWKDLSTEDLESLWSSVSNVVRHNNVHAEELADENSRFLPANQYKKEFNLTAHFPVVMFPGISANSIESWGTETKDQKYFRKRIWGRVDMLNMLLSNSTSWLEHIKLDPVTGLDPPGIKLRAVEGLTSADYSLPGYWVWAKVIENLAAIGYDTTSMHVAAYDWRLSLWALEYRDQYFSHTKQVIEDSKENTGKKTVLLAHSMGAQVAYYFLKWVEQPEHGGPGWAEHYIETLVNINGGLLGAPKTLSLMLTGDTSDTVTVNRIGKILLERLICRGKRADLTRNWPGFPNILPKGGNVIWGDSVSAPDDINNDNPHTLGEMISFSSLSINTRRYHRHGKYDAAAGSRGGHHRDHLSAAQQAPLANHTVDMALALLTNISSSNFGDMLNKYYTFGVTTSKKQLEESDHLQHTWNNPLDSRLPIAPSMKIYCLYGVGSPTERGYYLSPTTAAAQEDNSDDTTCMSRGSILTAAGTDQPMHLLVDTSVDDPTHGVRTGVRYTEGDRTVPLVSNGYMCAQNGAWVKHADLYNPGRNPIIVREYPNEIVKGNKDSRGGPKAATHVEILGNHDVLLDLLSIVSNQGDRVQQRVVSNIEDIAQRINLEHHD